VCVLPAKSRYRGGKGPQTHEEKCIAVSLTKFSTIGRGKDPR